MDDAYKNWRQNDPRYNQSEAWPASRFPVAEYRYFEDCGCLVCALAVMLRCYGIEKTEDEDLFNPWILNQRLVDCGAFTPEADLELSFVSRLYPIEYLGATPYSRDALAEVVGRGLPCLITVPGEKTDIHFTALCRMLGGDALVYDPLCGERMLDSYDRVCEIRTFQPAGQGL